MHGSAPPDTIRLYVPSAPDVVDVLPDAHFTSIVAPAKAAPDAAVPLNDRSEAMEDPLPPHAATVAINAAIAVIR